MFKMNKKIDNPADCEVRSVIRFLNAQNVRAIDIHRQLTAVYGEGIMNESSVRKWCRMFNEGRTNVHDEERSGRPSLITEDLKKQIDEQIRQERRSTLDKLHEKFLQISRSLRHEILSKHLGYRNICARWVPRMLADDHRKESMGAALTFLERYHRDGDKFLDHIVTGDGTWVSHFTPESKRQSLEWLHPRSPSKPTKFKQTLSTRKIMATVFWDRKGVLLVEFMPQDTTINAESYCATLRRLRYAIENRRRSLLSSGVMLLHDNAVPHAAARTQAMLQEFGWEVFEHPAYSPDLAPSDFHLLQKLKEFLGGRRFKSDEEVNDVVKEWLNGLAAEVYDEGIQKLVTRYDKCLNVGGGYV
jgi:histone-lysine N-methyltransferase SETMAR